MSAVLEHIRAKLADAKLNLQLAIQQRDRHSINVWKHKVSELKRMKNVCESLSKCKEGGEG